MNTLRCQHRCDSGLWIKLIHGDITLETVDAIVNAANSRLAHGGGVAAAIARRGGPEVQRESDRWVAQHGPVPTGGVAMTGAGQLPSKVVIHAVGPVWRGGQANEESELRSAVWESLLLADRHGFVSIALPAISAGIFGFPVERCAQILLKTAKEFAEQHPQSPLRDIRVVLYDQPTLDVFEREFRQLFPEQSE